jgi:hypothetical protein
MNQPLLPNQIAAPPVAPVVELNLHHIENLKLSARVAELAADLVRATTINKPK